MAKYSKEFEEWWAASKYGGLSYQVLRYNDPHIVAFDAFKAGKQASKLKPVKERGIDKPSQEF